MQLVEAGRVELDAPVQRYLPWFRVADGEAGHITVRHLLHHMSGFPRSAGDQPMNAGDGSDADIENGARALAAARLNRPVGATYEYSNVNYNVLGAIVQAASGQSYEAYVQRHIFDPLDMRHSFSSEQAARDGGLANGHVFWFGMPVPFAIAYPRSFLPADCSPPAPRTWRTT